MFWNMKEIFNKILVVSLVVMAISCSNTNDFADGEYISVDVIRKALSVKWDASKKSAINQMSSYQITVNEPDYLEVVPVIGATVSYQFSDDKMCAIMIASNGINNAASSLFTSKKYLGDIDNWSLSVDKEKNIIIYNLKDDTDGRQIVAFTPIESDVFFDMPNVVVTTDVEYSIISSSSGGTCSLNLYGSVEGFVEGGETGIIWSFNTPPNPTNGHVVLSNSHSRISARIDNIERNKLVYYRAFFRYKDNYFYGVTRSVLTPKITKGSTNGHDWVDLGLPSGTKWATMNVGASMVADFGNYYAWGMTRTTSVYGVSYYDYYDNSTMPWDISGTQYDVAKKLWGDSWRMPTFIQFKELAQNCTFEWTNKSGVYGALLTGPNDEEIFFPAAGAIGPMYSNISRISYDGERGNYWSSSLYSRSNGNMSNYFYFNSSGITLRTTLLGSTSDINTNCFNGMQIRPVTK